MDYDAILARLAAQTEALTAPSLAELFEFSTRSIDYHIKHHGLPEPFFRPPNPRRFWRPRDLIAWVREQQCLAREGLTLAQVYERTGLTERRWREMRKEGRAPAPAGRELRTGVLRWWPEDIDALLQEISGGYRIPPRRGGRVRSRERQEAQDPLGFTVYFSPNTLGMSAVLP